MLPYIPIKKESLMDLDGKQPMAKGSEVLFGPGQYAVYESLDDNGKEQYTIDQIVSSLLQSKGQDYLSFNVEPHLFTSYFVTHLLHRVSELCNGNQQQMNTLLSHISLEVLETGFLSDDALFWIQKLHSQGVSFAVDDVPAGSSLKNSKSLGISGIPHKIKIDWKEFQKKAKTDDRGLPEMIEEYSSPEYVTGVIVEGVENLDLFTVAQQIRAQMPLKDMLFQGYLFSPHS